MRSLIYTVPFAFVGALIWAACGGDSSGGSEDGVALCKESCNKYVSLCVPDAGGGLFDCDRICTQQSDGGTGGGRTCTNAAEISAATRACLQKTTCQELTACNDAVPDCQGGTGGTGGSGGSGATGGSGGSTGGTGGTTGGSGGTGGGGSGTCAQLLACCNAATNEQLKTACMMAYNAAMPSGDATCGAVYTQLKPTICP